MLLGKLDQLVHIQVWSPRWHDRKALVACYKVDNAKTDHIKITFPKSKPMEGQWYISRKKARKFPKETNGTIMCYAIPLDKLEPLAYSERDIREYL